MPFALVARVILPFSYSHFKKVLVLTAMTLSVSLFGAEHFYELHRLDVAQPFCEGRAQLGVAHQYFVEIANNLPGKDDYNKLVELYRTKKWDRLDDGIDLFRHVYEGSPLQEAVSFLRVQSLFDRVDVNDTSPPKEAEKALRETLLLYPHSTLAPVITASVAAFWLTHGLSSKALALFERAHEDYPFHELSCLFELGVGESNYLERRDEAAERAFQEVMQKCTADRIRVGAQVRLAILALNKKQEGQKAQKQLETLYSNYGAVISHYYPMTLYDLGELKYREENYPSAKFYYKEFLKHRGKDINCYANTLKRLADIAFHRKENLKDVVGMYLATHEEVPTTDAGHFSYLHALLLDSSSVSEAEMDRRIKVVDDEVEKIRDPNLQQLGYLEKGLALLERGEKSALGYLVRLNERSEFDLKKGEIATFVREKLLTILEGDVEREVSSDQHAERLRDKRIFGPIEAAYPIWLENTPYQNRAQRFYGAMILRRFSSAMEGKNLTSALDKLERWTSSKLWPRSGADASERATVSESIAKLIVHSPEDQWDDFIKEIKTRQKVLEPFFSKEFGLMRLITLLPDQDEKQIASCLKQVGSERGLASISAKMPNEVQSYLWHLKGLALRSLKRYDEADRALAKVTDPALSTHALMDRMAIGEESKQYGRVVQLGLQVIPKLKDPQKLEYLNQASRAVELGKLWRKAPAVTDLAVKSDLKGKDLAPFEYLLGRSQFELSQCKLAIQSYEKAFALDDGFKDKAAAKFRAGKCYLKERHPIEARKSFEDLAGMKDKFWSPLAQSELEMMEPK